MEDRTIVGKRTTLVTISLLCLLVLTSAAHCQDEPPPSDLAWSTFLGGSGSDYGLAIAVDASGCVYVASATHSPNFPTVAGSLDVTFNGGTWDVAVTKISADGKSIVYSTLLGGKDSDYPFSIAVDAAGCAYVAGYTSSSDFPTTPGAFDTTHNGGWDVFVTKLNASGSAMVYSTFIGGTSVDVARGIAVDSTGSIYAAGYTSSSDFPTTPGAFGSIVTQTDAFVLKLNASGSGLDYCTLLGGGELDYAWGICVDESTGSACVAGFTNSADFPATAGAFDTSYNGEWDAFAARINPMGTKVEYATFLGGPTTDIARAIALDPAGRMCVVGKTNSSDYPVTPLAIDAIINGFDDAFVTVLDNDGADLYYSTFLGGSGNDAAQAVAVDSFGQVCVAGRTESSNFPTSAGAYDTSYKGAADAFVTKVDAVGSAAVYSTYIGGSALEDTACQLALDDSGFAHVTGKTASGAFPTTSGVIGPSYAGSEDGFVSTIALRDSDAPTGTITIDGGVFATRSTSVTLGLIATDAGGTVTDMRFSTDNETWTDWESYAQTRSWELDAEDGRKTIYVQYRDADGHESAAYSRSIVLDTVSPTGTVLVCSGAEYALRTPVTLALSGADTGSGVKAMRFSNGGAAWSDWRAYSTTSEWVLTPGDGPKTVYAQFRDAAGNESDVCSDDILLNTTIAGTVTINSGARFTGSTSAQLSIDAVDAAEMRLCNEDGQWDQWQAYAISRQWTLTSGEGVKTVSVQFRDALGKLSSTFSDTITMDTAPPSGTVLINGGTGYASSTKVMLTLSATDAVCRVSHMRLSQDGTDWVPWEPYAAARQYELTGVGGEKSVFAQFRDEAGNVSEACSDTIYLETAAPTGSITINSGAEFANSAAVMLSLSADDEGSGVAKMRFSTDSTTWTAWEAFAASKPWTLTGGDGRKTVFAQFCDSAGNVSEACSDSITLDSTAPSGSVRINDDAQYASAASVVLNLTAVDPGSGVSDMRLSTDGSTWGAWESYATTRAWTLTLGDGEKRIYVQYRDVLGNTSASCSDSIRLDTLPPTGTVTIDSGRSFTYSTSVTLACSASDSGSGVSQMRIRNSGTEWGAWETYSPGRLWDLTPGDGAKTVEAQFKDGVGRISQTCSDSITYQSVPLKVVSTSPASSATDVGVRETLLAAFSKALAASSVSSQTFLLYDADGAQVQGLVGYDPSMHIATLTPVSPLAYGTIHTAVIKASVRDTNGGELQADYSWQFTTAAAPTDDAYEPNDVPADAFDFTGSPAMWLSQISGTAIQANDDFYAIEVDAAAPRVLVDCAFIHSEGDINIQLLDATGQAFTPLHGSRVSATTANTEHIDCVVPVAGVYLVKVRGANAWNAYDLRWECAADWQGAPPRVVSVSPSGSELAALDAPVVIGFDRAMDRASTEAAISVLPGLESPQCFWSDDSTTLTIVHAGFYPATDYTGIVAASASDTGGITRAQEYAWGFTTTSSWARFETDRISVIGGSTFATPRILVADPAKRTSVTIVVTVPTGVAIDPLSSGGSLACVAVGKDAYQLTSEWDPASRSITITARLRNLTAVQEVVKSIRLTAPAAGQSVHIWLDDYSALTIRCDGALPGDFDLDGAVTIADASRFINAWVRTHRGPVPPFDAALDSPYDLAPRTSVAWPFWSSIGDRRINIDDASAFIDCWVNSRSASTVGPSPLAMQTVRAAGIEIRGDDLTVTLDDAPGGMFETSVVLPADRAFDASAGPDGNLARVTPGTSVGSLFFTEYDDATRAVHITGCARGGAPYVVASVHLQCQGGPE